MLFGQRREELLFKHKPKEIDKFHSNINYFNNKSIKVGVVIGTYGTLSYVHLFLENAKRHNITAPSLIVDDCSGINFSKLTQLYNCDFVSNSKRKGHQLGDLNVFTQGIKWAESKNLDYIIKISRRFILLYDFVRDFKSQKLDAEMYSTEHESGIRTSVMALSVPKFKQTLYQKCVDTQHVECMERVAEEWSKTLNFKYWSLLKFIRTYYINQYIQLSKYYDLPYKEEDFRIPGGTKN